MRTQRHLLMLLFGSLISLGGNAYAANVHGQVVYTSNGAPAPYVAVRLNTPGKGASEFAYSGNDGKYYLQNIPAGSYQLEVWRGGRVVVTVAVTVQEPDTALAPARLP